MNLAVEAVFDPDLGVAKPATFRPGEGAPVEGVAVIWSGEAAPGAGWREGPGVIGDGRMLDVLVAHAAEPSKGDIFEVNPGETGAAQWAVVGDPWHPDDDTEHLIWRCKVEKVTV